MSEHRSLGINYNDVPVDFPCEHGTSNLETGEYVKSWPNSSGKSALRRNHAHTEQSAP
jgi:hypothetical protein